MGGKESKVSQSVEVAADGNDLVVTTVLRNAPHRERPSVLRIHHTNAGWLAGRLREYLGDHLFKEIEETRGEEVIVVLAGGTDHVPRVAILVRRVADDASRGSMWLGDDAAARLAAELDRVVGIAPLST